MDPYEAVYRRLNVDPYQRVMSRLYGGQPSVGIPQQQAAVPMMGDAEVEDMLGAIARGATSGVSAVGAELDKLFGGRAVRGLLHGLSTGDLQGFRDILSIIPGTDILGITNPEHVTSGRQLLQDWGIADEPDPEESFWTGANLGGVALEMALSPDLWLGLGGMRAGSQALKKAGLLRPGFKAGMAKTGAEHLAETVAARTASEMKVVEGGLIGKGLGKKAIEELPPEVAATAWRNTPDAVRGLSRGPLAEGGFSPMEMGFGEWSPGTMLEAPGVPTPAGRVMREAGYFDALPEHAAELSPREYLSGIGHEKAMQDLARAAEASGVKVEDVLANTPRQLVNFRPIGMDTITGWGGGPKSQAVAGAMDKAMEWTRAALPVRVGAALFNPRTEGVFGDIPHQRAAQQAHDLFRADVPKIDRMVADGVLELGESGLDNRNALLALREYMEGGDPMKVLGPGGEPAIEAIKRVAQPIKAATDEAYARYIAMGGDAKYLDDYGARVATQLSEMPGEPGIATMNAESSARSNVKKVPSEMHRKEMFVSPVKIMPSAIDELSTTHGFTGIAYDLKPGEKSENFAAHLGKDREAWTPELESAGAKRRMSEGEAATFAAKQAVGMTDTDLKQLVELRKVRDDAELARQMASEERKAAAPAAKTDAIGRPAMGEAIKQSTTDFEKTYGAAKEVPAEASVKVKELLQDRQELLAEDALAAKKPTESDQAFAMRLNANNGLVRDIDEQLKELGYAQPGAKAKPQKQPKSTVPAPLDAATAIAPQSARVAPAAEFTEEMAARLDDLEGRWNQAVSLSTYFSKTNPRRVSEDLGLFGGHPLADTRTRVLNMQRATANMEATHDLYRAGAKPLSEITDPQNWVLLPEALNKAGMGRLAGRAGLQPTKGAVLQMSNRLGVTASELKNWAVPVGYAEKANNLSAVWKNPEAIKPILQKWMQYTGLWKDYATMTWPASRTRDYTSNKFMLGLAGGRDTRYGLFDPRSWLKPDLEMEALMKGKPVAGLNEIPLLRGMTPKAAQQEVARLMYEHQIIGHGYGNEVLSDVAPSDLTGQFASRVTRAVPGEVPIPAMNPAAVAYRSLPRSLEEANPLNTMGWRGAEAGDKSSIIREGRRTAGFVDDMTRGGAFISMLRQGYAPEVAAAEIKAAAGEFTAAAKTPFEREVMTKLIPFYSYLRQVTPFIVKQVLGNPSGPMNQSMKLANMVRQQQGFLPEHVAAGLAVPITDENGTRTYLTRFDLPHEALFDLIRPGGTLTSTLAKTGGALLGMTNPLVKVPLELATGKQFFTGRDLKDLDSSVGRIVQNLTGADQPPIRVPPVVEELLGASPWSRGVTTLRQVTDPRKLGQPWKLAVNLGTGARVSDVNMEKAKELATRDYIRDVLAGRPNIHQFQNLYVRKEDAKKVTPEDMALLSLNRALVKRAQDAAKERQLQALQASP